MLGSVPDGCKMTPATARPIADVYACIRALSDAAVSLSLHVYRRIGAGERERVDNRTADLLRRPPPAPTQANLIGQLVAHLNVAGNAYLGKFRNSQGAVDQLAHDEVVHVHVKPGETVIVNGIAYGDRAPLQVSRPVADELKTSVHVVDANAVPNVAERRDPKGGEAR